MLGPRWPDCPNSIDPSLAAELLADWGFLADPDLPDRPGPAYLLVAIRAKPTLRHYDPELVEYWVTDDKDHGVNETITFASRLPRQGEFSWGRISVIDRKGVANRYLTFGGTLRAERINGEVICVFESPAPLLRRGGHSQGWDTGAHSVGGFFGRFRAAAGYQHEFERRAAHTDPVTRYAAFVNEFVTRYRGQRVPARPLSQAVDAHAGRGAPPEAATTPAAWARAAELPRRPPTRSPPGARPVASSCARSDRADDRTAGSRAGRRAAGRPRLRCPAARSSCSGSAPRSCPRGRCRGPPA